MNSLNRFADPVFGIARLLIGLMYACHGGQKILGFPPGGHGMPPGAMGAIGAWIELAGGFMIALGFLARIAASWPPAKWRWPISWSTPKVDFFQS